MTLKNKLKQARKLLNLTQTEMATGIGIPQKVISLIESGKREHIPTEYFLFLLSKNVDLNKLFDENEKVSFIVKNEEDKEVLVASENNDNILPYSNLIKKVKYLESTIEDMQCTMNAMKVYLQIEDDLTDNKIIQKKKLY